MDPEPETIGRLSVVIPTLNEAGTIEACIASLGSLASEIIVADGGSADATVSIARSRGAAIVHALAGRGCQLAAGAGAASGTWLLFLHADSQLSASARSALAEALRTPGFSVGTFRLRFDRPHPLYRLYAWLTRFDSIWTSFGDQGILIHRDLYNHIGGFDRWPLLEDVALLRRARRRAVVRSLPGTVITSARRFERSGIVRQQIINGFIILGHLLGVRPDRLARIYESGRPALAGTRTGGVLRGSAKYVAAHGWCVALLTGLVALHACGDGTHGNEKAGAAQAHDSSATSAVHAAPAAPPEHVQKQAEAALLREPGLGGVRVTSRGPGVLRLHGVVGSGAERDAAAQSIQAIRGVDSVVNDITVREIPSR